MSPIPEQELRQRAKTLEPEGRPVIFRETGRPDVLGIVFSAPGEASVRCSYVNSYELLTEAIQHMRSFCSR
jgi:hypothetical protein